MVEVDPAGLPGDVVAPLGGVAHHRGAAGVVELLDAEVEDLLGGLQPELAHRLELGGQAVGVPAEPALDPAAAHGLVARDQVLDVAGQQVAVVRQPVGERRAVVEDELVVAVLAGVPLLDAGPEGVVVLPVRQHPLLDLGEVRGRADGAMGLRWRPSDRSWAVLLRYVVSVCLPRGRRAPRYHLACRARGRDRFVHGCDGPTRPVLVRPLPVGRDPFFRRLAADDGSNACGHRLRRPLAADQSISGCRAPARRCLGRTVTSAVQIQASRPADRSGVEEAHPRGVRGGGARAGRVGRRDLARARSGTGPRADQPGRRWDGQVVGHVGVSHAWRDARRALARRTPAQPAVRASRPDQATRRRDAPLLEAVLAAGERERGSRR